MEENQEEVTAQRKKADLIFCLDYNLQGQKMMHLHEGVSKDIKVDLSDLNKGVYIMKIRDKLNSVSKKVIKL